AVVLGEVDQFCDIRVRLDPGLADFIDHPGSQLELALADLRSRAEQSLRALAGIRELPRPERAVRGQDRLARVLVRAADGTTDHDGAVEGAPYLIDRPVRDLLAIDDHRPGASELPAHLLQSLLHRLAVLRLREVGERLVSELRYHCRLSQGGTLCPPGCRSAAVYAGASRHAGR